MQTDSREKLLFLSHEVGTFISHQYPFKQADAAAMAYMNFRPSRYVDVYWSIYECFRETFIRALVCSMLEGIEMPSLRALIPEILKTPLPVFKGFLQLEEIMLPKPDKRILLLVISYARKDFSEALIQLALAKLH